jgi:hypothetical protein
MGLMLVQPFPLGISAKFQSIVAEKNSNSSFLQVLHQVVAGLAATSYMFV